MTAILNQIAENWFSWQLSMFWQVGLLIIIIAGLDLLIKKWVWPQVRYALWLLILVKLVLPPTLTSPASFTAEIPFMVKQAAIKISQPQASQQVIKPAELVISPAAKLIPADITTQPVEIASAAPAVPVIPAVVRLSWKVHVLFVWLGGVAVLTGWLIIRLSNLRREHLKNQSRLPERLDDLLASTAQKLGLKKVPQIILTNKVCCPAVFGVFRPVLLMPADKLQNMTTQDVEHIFLHELAHIKRGDLSAHAVYMILQIAYWFNPLLWLIRKHLQNLRELCCDATVARMLREKTADYRQTLLETARQLLAVPVDPGLGLLGLFENSSWFVDRLRWLEKKSWKYRPLQITTVFVLICLMSACVLPMTKSESPADLVIRGTVTDAQTGKPIAGAKVGDYKYCDGIQWTVTDSNGNYSYLTWPEHHSIFAESAGYKSDRKSLYSGHFTLNKKDEEIFDFALEPNAIGKNLQKSTGQAERSIEDNVNAMMVEMQPCLTEIQKEAVKLKQLKAQDAPQSEIKASENRIEELGKKIDAIGNKWGKKMDSSGEQVGKDVQVQAQEYRAKYWEQFGERMAQWGEQFGEKMQRKYEQTGKTWDTGKNGFEKTETLSAPFAEGSLLVAETLDSDITVTGGLGTECRVTAKIRARASTSSDAEQLAKQVKIGLKQEPGKVTVAVDNNEDENVSVDLNITVPRKASLQCRTGDRYITCSELEGQVTANIGDGSIAITKLLGNASVKLGDGQIKYADSKGSFDAQLGDGKVVVQNAEFTEKCDVKMGDGQLIFENIRGKAHYEISVKDGTAKFAYAKDADGVGHMELDVADGKIEFGCPANMSAKIEADVEDGMIQTSLPLMVERKDDSAKLDGTLGSGQGHIELSVKDGTIKINAEDSRAINEHLQIPAKQSEAKNEINNASEKSAENVKTAKALKITVYEGNNAEPQTTVYIPLVAMKIVHQLLPSKDKLQIIAQKIKLDESLPEGLDSNSLIDMLDGMLKQVDQGIEATTLLEVKDGTDHVIIALE